MCDVRWLLLLAGLVPPATAVFLMGKAGSILIVTMLFMAVTSAGSAELVAVSSLFTYDIYRTYINPKATGAPTPSLECFRVFYKYPLDMDVDIESPEYLYKNRT